MSRYLHTDFLFIPLPSLAKYYSKFSILYRIISTQSCSIRAKMSIGEQVKSHYHHWKVYKTYRRGRLKRYIFTALICYQCYAEIVEISLRTFHRYTWPIGKGGKWQVWEDFSERLSSHTKRMNRSYPEEAWALRQILQSVFLSLNNIVYTWKCI